VSVPRYNDEDIVEPNGTRLVISGEPATRIYSLWVRPLAGPKCYIHPDLIDERICDS
jgi:hypothetical protein